MESRVADSRYYPAKEPKYCDEGEVEDTRFEDTSLLYCRGNIWDQWSGNGHHSEADRSESRESPEAL